MVPVPFLWDNYGISHATVTAFGKIADDIDDKGDDDGQTNQ